MYNQDIGMNFILEKCAMLMTKSGKQTYNRRNRTTKSRKNQNARRKGKLQILGNIESGNQQNSADEIKNIKRVSRNQALP